MRNFLFSTSMVRRSGFGSLVVFAWGAIHLVFWGISPLSAQSDPDCLGIDGNWVFCTGFEEGNLDIWDDYDGNPPETNTLMSHPGPFDRPDNTVVRLRAPAGSGGADLVEGPTGPVRPALRPLVCIVGVRL